SHAISKLVARRSSAASQSREAAIANNQSGMWLALGLLCWWRRICLGRLLLGRLLRGLLIGFVSLPIVVGCGRAAIVYQANVAGELSIIGELNDHSQANGVVLEL